MNTDRVIDYKKLINSSDVLLGEVERTYISSFPIEERRDMSLFRDLLDIEPKFNVYALLDDGNYVGFITEWIFDEFVYVEHFAIDETARNGGFGGIAMKQFIEKTITPVVLEVELPVDEYSKRRIGFYERLGFVPDNHEYQQPPYHKGDSWLPMRLMTYGSIDLKKKFDYIKTCLYRNVYGVNQ